MNKIICINHQDKTKETDPRINLNTKMQTSIAFLVTFSVKYLPLTAFVDLSGAPNFRTTAQGVGRCEMIRST